jgi:hypothetical protein
MKTERSTRRPYPFAKWFQALETPIPEPEAIRLYLELRSQRQARQPGLWPDSRAAAPESAHA